MDERGYFVEVLRQDDPGVSGISQVSISHVNTGVIKAWHMHLDQTESMAALAGWVMFSFSDRRKESKTFGETQQFSINFDKHSMVFTVPPGVAHGYKVIKGPAMICYIANRIYDPSDQIKIPHDDKEIGYDWLR